MLVPRCLAASLCRSLHHSSSACSQPPTPSPLAQSIDGFSWGPPRFRNASRPQSPALRNRMKNDVVVGRSHWALEMRLLILHSESRQASIRFLKPPPEAPESP